MLGLRKKEKLELVPPPQEKRKGGNSRKVMFISLIFAVLAVGGAYGFKLYLEGFFTDTPVPSKTKPRAAQSEPFKPAPVQPAMQTTADSGAFEPDNPLREYAREKSEALTVLLADKEVLEAQLENARLEQQIAELVTGSLPGPAVQAPTLPSEDVRPTSSGLPLIRSIAGIDGKLTAVLVSGGAARAVQKGDGFAGGKVLHIHAYGVDFRADDGLVYALNFED